MRKFLNGARRWLLYLVVGLVLPACLLLAVGPFFNLRNPLSNDPFNYLAAEPLKWLYQPWIYYNRTLAQHRWAGLAAVERSLKVYQAAVETQVQLTFKLDAHLLKVEAKGKPQCFDVIYSPPGQPGFILPAAIFEKNPRSAVCEFEVEWAKLSDDGKLLAVEVRSYLDDRFETVWIFTMDGRSPPAHSHTLDKSVLTRPHVFADSKTVLFRTRNDRYVDETSCSVSAWQDGETHCFIAKDQLPKDREFDYFLRTKGSDALGIMLAAKGALTYDAYPFKQGETLRFDKPQATNVLHYAPLQQGFVYGQEVDTQERYRSVLNIYRVAAPKTDHQLLLSVPYFQSSWMGFANQAFVMHRDLASMRYRLHLISDAGSVELPLSEALATAQDLALASSMDHLTPRVRFTAPQGEFIFGALKPDGGLVPDTRVEPFQPLHTHYFEAKSADGALVPCKFVQRAGLTGPLPTVLESYGAYGATSYQSVRPGIAALLSNDIGYLFASPRGGGARGRQWQADGNGAHRKLKTVEDTEACLSSALSQGLALRGKVLMYGASAGAIPAVVTALRQPGVVAGAWADVPYLDSSGRYQNGWRDEQAFGIPSNSEEGVLRAAMSPYDNLLKPSDQSADFLFSCGDRDNIIGPRHCMMGHAAVQAGHPNARSHFIVRTDTSHGIFDSTSATTLNNVRMQLGFVLTTLRPELFRVP